MSSPDLPTGNSMRAPRRARAVINRLLGERKLTETGLAWLVAATDPFHDSAVTPTGFPDLNSTNTLVQCYTQTAAITAPSSAGSGSWDAHFLFCPVLGSAYSDPVLTPFTYTANSFSFATSGGIGAPLYSGYNCVAGAQGFSLISTAAASLTVTQQSPPRRAYGGEYRLVAAGFEVTNTTAELYKGGAVTAWRAPNTPSRLVNVYNSAATTTTPITVYCGNAPPTDQGKAQLYPTAKTWGASDGVYGIATLIGETNPFVIANATQPFFVQAPSSTDLAAGNTVPCWTSATTQVLGNATMQAMIPYAWHGAMFTGLPNQSALQFTTKYYVERCPSVSEPDFLVLARPPPDFDPMALEIYTRSVCELPVAVPVDENPLGEWFNDVLDTVSEWAPKIGGVIGGHGATLGNVLGNLAGKSATERRAEISAPSEGVLAQAPKQSYVPRPISQPAQRIKRPPIAAATKTKRRRQRKRRNKN